MGVKILSYTKQNFVDGQVLYASHLKHIEDGIKELESLVGTSGSNVFVGRAGEVTYSDYSGANNDRKACFLYVDLTLYVLGKLDPLEVVFYTYDAPSGNLKYAKLDRFTNELTYGDVQIANPVASPVSIVDIELLASAWVGSESLYSQVVSIDGITENSQVNLAPSVEQLAIFYDKDITFVTENDGGVVTVYVIGQKPQNDYTIQADIVEVIV